MTIEIHQPHLEALIEQRMASGQFESVEDLLLQTLEVLPAIDSAEPGRISIAEQSPTQGTVKKQNFSDFLLNSPLHGSGIVVERSKDFPRPVDL